MGSKSAEDLQYAKEMIFQGAQKGLEIKETSWPHRPLIVVPGFANGYLEKGIKGLVKKFNIKGQLLEFGMFTKGLRNEDYSGKLIKTIEKYPHATVLAYSTGGLMAVNCLEENNVWDGIDGLFTIGSPFGGVSTPSVARALSQTFKDISPDSDLLAKIRKIKPPPGKQVVSFVAENDEHLKEVHLNWPTVVLGKNGQRPLSHGDLQNHYEWLEPWLELELGMPWESVVK